MPAADELHPGFNGHGKILMAQVRRDGCEGILKLAQASNGLHNPLGSWIFVVDSADTSLYFDK